MIVGLVGRRKDKGVERQVQVPEEAQVTGRYFGSWSSSRTLYFMLFQIRSSSFASSAYFILGLRFFGVFIMGLCWFFL